MAWNESTFAKLCRRDLALALGILSVFGEAPARPLSTNYRVEVETIFFRLTEPISRARMTSVAVLDFGPFEEQVTELGRFLAELLLLGLCASGLASAVVDRAAVRAVINERHIAVGVGLDTEMARQLANAGGVAVCGIGAIIPSSEDIKVVATFIHASRTKLMAAAHGAPSQSHEPGDLLRRIRPPAPPRPAWLADYSAFVSCLAASQQESGDSAAKKEYLCMQSASGSTFEATSRIEKEEQRPYSTQNVAPTPTIIESILTQNPEDCEAHYRLAAYSRNLKKPDTVPENVCIALHRFSGRSLYLSVVQALTVMDNNKCALAWMEKVLPTGSALRVSDYDHLFPAFVGDQNYHLLLPKHSGPHE